MIHELLDVIKNKSQEEILQTAIDNYLLIEGYYFKVSETGEILETKYVAKETSDISLAWYASRSFYSDALNGQELDCPAKKLRTNNYLSIGFKNEEEKKLNEDIFSIIEKKLFDFELSKNISAIYNSFEIEKLNIDDVEKCLNILKDSLLTVNKFLEDKEKGVIVKIFLDKEIKFYKNEYLRYVGAKIFPEKEIIFEDGEIFGPSSFKISYNSKKKYIVPFQTKFKKPFMLTAKQAIDLKHLGDILVSSSKKTKELYIPYSHDFVSICDENTNGYKLNIQKGKKGIDIYNFELFSPEITNNNNFKIENYLGSEYFDSMDFKSALDKYFFDGLLKINMESKNANASIYIRDGIQSIKNSYIRRYYNDIYDYFYNNGNLEAFSNKMIDFVISICGDSNIFDSKNYFNKLNAFNLYLNISERILNKKMDIKNKINDLFEELDNSYEIKNNEEFMILAGQLIRFLLTKSETKEKSQGNLARYSNCKNPDILKSRIVYLTNKYSYKISAYDKKYNNLCAAIFAYSNNNVLTKEEKSAFLAGFYSESVLYKRKEKEIDNE